MSIKKSQFIKLENFFERIQRHTSDYKKKLRKERDKYYENSKEWNELDLKMSKSKLLRQRNNYEVGSDEWNKWNELSLKVSTISDGTKTTYLETIKAVLRQADKDYGIKRIKELTPKMTKEIIQKRIDRGESPQNIRKVVHSLAYLHDHGVKTGVFKEHEINVVNHQENLELLKERNVIRTYKDSHRYTPTRYEALAVIEEMEKRDPELAEIARFQYYTGFRVSEAIRQKGKNMHVEEERVVNEKAKGGVTNTVHINHLEPEEKQFLINLKNNTDEETGRIFERKKKIKDKRYKSDTRIREQMTKLVAKCAADLGIGSKEKTFSSHSFRAGFASERMRFYARNHDKLDQIIDEKIVEQQRLGPKYDTFERRIRKNVKKERRKDREIQKYEKIQWLISTDLNHSRQDVTRYYVSAEEIRKELEKYTREDKDEQNQKN